MSDLDDEELGDLAAELDDDEPDPEAGSTADDDEPQREYRSGRIVGGPHPYPGQQMVSRFPAGVLLIDKSRQRAWIFDYKAGEYRVRDEDGATLDEAGRWRAAEGGTYDVRAYDPEFRGDTVPTMPAASVAAS